MHAATAFGLFWQSEVPLEHFSAAPDFSGVPDVNLRLVAALLDRPSGRAINRGLVFADGFRFTWNDIATFDVFGGNRIDVLPLSGWTGTLPWPFYSTVTALLLAWRGNLPLHACAVEIAGKALLLCGPSGAGKSTLCAALVADGARLLSDDLSVIRPGTDGQPPMVLPGRPGVRLLSTIAPQLPGARLSPVSDDHRAKVMAIWSGRSAEFPRAITAVVLLQNHPAPVSPVARVAMLRQHLFRPQWLGLLPRAQAQFQTLALVVESARMLAAPTLGPFNAREVAARITALTAIITETSA